MYIKTKTKKINQDYLLTDSYQTTGNNVISNHEILYIKLIVEGKIKLAPDIDNLSKICIN